MKFTQYDYGICITTIVFLFNSLFAPITTSTILLFLAGYFAVWLVIGVFTRSFELSSYDVSVIVSIAIFAISAIFNPLTAAFFVSFGVTYLVMNAVFGLIARSRS